MMNSSQDILLITGCTKGIGKYLTEYYLGQGKTVIGCGRSESKISHPRHFFYQADIASESSVIEMFKQIRKKFQYLDIVVNNAGINPKISLSTLLSYKVALDIVNTNVLGTFLVSREASKLMIQHKFGRIINFSSMAVRHEVKGEAIYTASKAAICAMTRVMAKEFYEFGITCNVISPSAIDTDMIKKIDPKELEKVLSLNAIQSVGVLEDVSRAIDFLIDRNNGNFTGQNLYLGGV
jgi:3-oxoacyl-[acyl-carrier protein] reductase